MPHWLKTCPDKEEARKRRNIERRKNYKKTQDDNRKYKRWAHNEICYILNTDDLDMEISRALDRSVQAIQIKRTRAIQGGFKC